MAVISAGACFVGPLKRVCHRGYPIDAVLGPKVTRHHTYYPSPGAPPVRSQPLAAEGKEKEKPPAGVNRSVGETRYKEVRRG